MARSSRARRVNSGINGMALHGCYRVALHGCPVANCCSVLTSNTCHGCQAQFVFVFVFVLVMGWHAYRVILRSGRAVDRNLEITRLACSAARLRCRSDGRLGCQLVSNLHLGWRSTVWLGIGHSDLSDRVRTSDLGPRTSDLYTFCT